jgi:hypothetical protein
MFEMSLSDLFSLFLYVSPVALIQTFRHLQAYFGYTDFSWELRGLKSSCFGYTDFSWELRGLRACFEAR